MRHNGQSAHKEPSLLLKHMHCPEELRGDDAAESVDILDLDDNMCKFCGTVPPGVAYCLPVNSSNCCGAMPPSPPNQPTEQISLQP